MDVSREDLDQATRAGILTGEQAGALWAHLAARSGAADVPRPRFDFAHVAYYFGALIVIAAMGWFMTLGWESFGGGGIFAIACAYALGFVLVGRAFWRKDHLQIPGGLLIVMAVGMTPLATYGLERLLQWWPAGDPGAYRGFHEWVKGGWFAMEVATVLAGAIAIHFFRFPFLAAPIAFTFWYMSMDLAPLLFHGDPSGSDRSWVSVAVGAMMLLSGYLIDRRTRQDFAFWLYLFGLTAFWGGLSSMESASEARAFVYLLVNVGLVLVSVALNRRVFLVFGALGVTGYLGHLAYHVFRDSMIFPFALSAVGLLIIAIGVHARRHAARYERAILNLVPAALREHLPPARAVPGTPGVARD